MPQSSKTEPPKPATPPQPSQKPGYEFKDWAAL